MYVGSFVEFQQVLLEAVYLQKLLNLLIFRSHDLVSHAEALPRHQQAPKQDSQLLDILLSTQLVAARAEERQI